MTCWRLLLVMAGAIIVIALAAVMMWSRLADAMAALQAARHDRDQCLLQHDRLGQALHEQQARVDDLLETIRKTQDEARAAMEARDRAVARSRAALAARPPHANACADQQVPADVVAWLRSLSDDGERR